MSESDEKPPEGEPSPDDQVGVSPEQIWMAARMQLATHLAALVGQFPRPAHLQPLTEESFNKLLDVLMAEQQQIHEQILPTLEVEAAREAPTVIIELGRPSHPNVKPAQITVCKRLDLNQEPAEVLSFACFMALLLSPAVRGLLKIHGYHYNFKEVKRSRIITN